MGEQYTVSRYPVPFPNSWTYSRLVFSSSLSNLLSSYALTPPLSLYISWEGGIRVQKGGQYTVSRYVEPASQIYSLQGWIKPSTFLFLSCTRWVAIQRQYQIGMSKNHGACHSDVGQFPGKLRHGTVNASIVGAESCHRAAFPWPCIGGLGSCRRN